ncbi:uncharacterized protein N7511_010546 [Penicillium nucicola]|uniref:uncharacterized protein n=1 Tax=Penicillium nucicola TaxID=1850975 RepID=UPI002545052F|nr:uncharacterized protein N7511_010546 [Penicillium nucicola]KAJ5748850.1 hypothetical protein N7511_010546 [Penicillium nucicola]
MGQNSSQPEGIPEIPDDFGVVVPETPYSEEDSSELKKRDKKNRHAKKKEKRERLSQHKEVNGIGTPPPDDNAKPSKRKREDEPERKKSKRKHRKDDAQHETESPSTTHGLMSSQATPLKLESLDKKARKSSKHKKDSNGTKAPASRAAKRNTDSKNNVRGPRVREADNKTIGFYTPEELEKIESHKVNFCKLHGISSLTFDELVHHSERGSQDWPLPTATISKSEFWDEIYCLLPGRDRRSVYRFMRRHFQGSSQRAHDWSPEQDEELIELHESHGPKWTYIGRLLGRSDDDVWQRWKNKLRYKDTMNRGSWSEEEAKLFLEAMQAVWESLSHTLNKEEKRKSLGKDFYEMDETLVPWGTISAALDNKRSEQQCSDKFRKLRPVVMKMRTNGNPDAVFDYEKSARRARHWNRKLGDHHKSEQYVKDDDSDVDMKANEVQETRGSHPTQTQVLSEIMRDMSHAPTEHAESESESESESAKKSKKSKKSKNSKPTEVLNADAEAVSSPKTKEEKKREKKERREKQKQEIADSELTSDKTARKERKKQKKEEKEILEAEERRAAEASSSEAQSEPRAKRSKKSKKASSDADHSFDSDSDNSQSSSAAVSSTSATAATTLVPDESDSDEEEIDSNASVKFESSLE